MIGTISQQTSSPEQSTMALNLREVWRTFRVASWLGWQIESNWADPFVFLSFTILRPLCTALVLLIMYRVVGGGNNAQFFAYLYISNAFFVLVMQTMAGMSWSVFDDREHYKMLKYIYTSPARQFPYLLGRAVAKIGVALLTTVILLLVGVLFLGLHLKIEQIQWGWAIVYFLLGMVILCSLGIVLAGVALVVARHGASIGEVTAGMLLLFSGAYFPPDILPPVLRQITQVMPITYWLEGMRRALNGGILTTTYPGGHGGSASGPISPLLAQFSDWQLLVIVLGSAAISAAVSFLFYRWVERQAKERGMIDRLTGY